MRLPLRTIRILCAALGTLLVPVALSACSSSTTSAIKSTSTTSAGTTKDISNTACALDVPGGGQLDHGYGSRHTHCRRQEDSDHL